MQRDIELTEEQLGQLEQLAAKERRSVDDLVRFAVNDYIARNTRNWSDWNRRFDELVARVQARMPTDVTPEEIEADITAAREEVRAEMRRELEEARRRETAGQSDARPGGAGGR